MSEIVKVKVFPFDKIVKLDISGGFYTRLNQFLVDYATQGGVKDLAKTLVELKDREPQSNFEYHLVTLISLVMSIEQEAQKQGLVESKEVPLPHNNEEKPPQN